MFETLSAMNDRCMSIPAVALRNPWFFWRFPAFRARSHLTIDTGKPARCRGAPHQRVASRTCRSRAAVLNISPARAHKSVRVMKRKIAAILAADVVGYSKLVAEDEEETLRRLSSYRAVFDDFIARGSGRVFNTAGDAILAEFPSAVEAVRCAIDVQESLRTRNLAYPQSCLSAKSSNVLPDRHYHRRRGRARR